MVLDLRLLLVRCWTSSLDLLLISSLVLDLCSLFVEHSASPLDLSSSFSMFLDLRLLLMGRWTSTLCLSWFCSEVLDLCLLLVTRRISSLGWSLSSSKVLDLRLFLLGDWTSSLRSSFSVIVFNLCLLFVENWTSSLRHSSSSSTVLDLSLLLLGIWPKSSGSSTSSSSSIVLDLRLLRVVQWTTSLGSFWISCAVFDLTLLLVLRGIDFTLSEPSFKSLSETSVSGDKDSWFFWTPWSDSFLGDFLTSSLDTFRVLVERWVVSLELPSSAVSFLGDKRLLLALQFVFIVKFSSFDAFLELIEGWVLSLSERRVLIRVFFLSGSFFSESVLWNVCSSSFSSSFSALISPFVSLCFLSPLIELSLSFISFSCLDGWVNWLLSLDEWWVLIWAVSVTESWGISTCTSISSCLPSLNSDITSVFFLLLSSFLEFSLFLTSLPSSSNWIFKNPKGLIGSWLFRDHFLFWDLVER